MGGHLSWSLALFDDGGDGMVLTSIHGRSDSRTYAKNVSGWSATQQLSPEEAGGDPLRPVTAVTGPRLHGVSAETLRALRAGAEDWAADEPGIESTPWPAEDRRMPRYRVEALDADPTCAPYLLHLVVDESGRLLGRIGCHAGPSPVGTVEVGYFVLPAERGHGVASFALDAFLGWLGERGVRRVLASVAPDNAPSRRLLERRGFVETDTRMDDEDGIELVYARSLSTVRP